MQTNESHEANPQASGSGQDPHREFQLNAKLLAKLENLAKWRLDPSLIEIPGDTHEFRGGCATISRARLAPTPNSQNSKAVAVKKLKIENDADLERVLGVRILPPMTERGRITDFSQLALRESELVARFSHPNIVGFEGIVEDASKHMVWLVFPWEENGNLRDFLASGGWEIPERISLIDDVAKGVEYLHSQTPPIYHGDLKSLNVLVNSSYYAVITDFGSARRLGTKDLDQEAKKREPQPRPEQVTGEESVTLQAVYSASTNTITLTSNKYTLRWAAPELLRDDPPRLASDIWALGWIAYEVMTNAIPFHDVKRDVAVIYRVIQGDLPSITHDARMSLIQALCSLMVRCWNIIPENRPTAKGCARLISWMPMIVPAPAQADESEASQTRNAALLLQLGRMYSRQSDYVNASDCFTKALNICATTQDTRGIADALRGFAEVHRFQAEYSKAANFYSEALQLYIEIGSHRWRAYALWGLAEMHRLVGEYIEASTFYSEALQIYTDLNDHEGRGSTLWGVAEIHRIRGEYDEAIKLYSESLQIRTDVGFSLGRADVLWSLGEVHGSRGEYSEAIKFHSESLQIYTKMGHKQGRTQVLCGLASVHLSREEYDNAVKLYSEALQLSTDIGRKDWRARTLLGLAETYDRQGHRSKAISFYTEASEAYQEIGLSQYAANALKSAADLRTEEPHDGLTDTFEITQGHLFVL